MWAIGWHEFKSLFKSIKALVIIAIIFGISYWTAGLMGTIANRFDVHDAENGSGAGIASIVFLLGFLFIAALSHDIMNREISTRTIRFLVTKNSRTNIVIGKYIGMWLFWFFCIFVSFMLIFLVSKNFLWWGLLECISFISVAIAYNLLFSIIIPKPTATMFFGVVFSLLFPAFSLWIINSSNQAVNWLKFFTPYYYALLGHFYTLMNVVYAIFVIGIGIILFNKKDL